MNSNKQQLERLIAKYTVSLEREISQKAKQHSLAESSRWRKIARIQWRINEYKKTLKEYENG